VVLIQYSQIDASEVDDFEDLVFNTIVTDYIACKSQRTDQFILLIDGEGLSGKNFDIARFKRNDRDISRFTPLLCAKIIVVRANWIISTMYKFCAAFMNDELKDRIQIIGKDLNEIKEV